MVDLLLEAWMDPGNPGNPGNYLGRQRRSLFIYENISFIDIESVHIRSID